MVRQVSRNAALLIGHATFITLLILAWQHAELRTTSGDSAFQVFKWIAYPGWNVEAHRYAAIFPQAVVKLFKLFGSSLSSLLLVASLAHVLVGYAVFICCAHFFRAPWSALGAVLAAVLCTRLTFYGPVLEANYLLCFPFLFFAFLERRGLKPFSSRDVILLLCVGAWTLFVHPLGWVLLAFGAVFLWSEGRLFAKQTFWIVGGLLFWALVSRWLFPPTAYEAAQYAKLGAGMADLGHISDWRSWEFLVGHTFFWTTNYLPALLFFVAVVGGFIGLRRYRTAAIIALGVVGFLLVMLVAFRSGDAAIMMDRAFLPVATLIALPTGFLLGRLHGRWILIASTCIVAVIFIKLRDISFGSRAPQQELDGKVALITEIRREGIAKAWVGDDVLSEYGITPDWAFSWSIMLLSAEEGPDHTMLILHAGNGSAGKVTVDLTSAEPDSATITMGLDTSYFRSPSGPFARLGDLPANLR